MNDFPSVQLASVCQKRQRRIDACDIRLTRNDTGKVKKTI